MTITRESAERYSIVTDKILSDGSMRADTDMRLMWSVRFGCWVLRSHEECGHIRISEPMTIPLQTAETETVRGLPIGASIKI